MNYPTLRIGVLKSLQEMKKEYVENPDILSADNCPYDPETTEVLKEILQFEIRQEVVAPPETRRVGRPEKGALSAEDRALIEEEAIGLLKELKDLGNVDKNVDEKTKLAIIKGKSTLIEQALKLRERVMNLRRQAEFESTVVGILEDLVPEPDRHEFLRRIEPFADDEDEI